MDSPKPLLQNKMSKFPARKYKVLNEGIEANLWFPKQIYGTSIRGYTMYLTFFFRTSKFTRVYFQRRKDETASSLKTFYKKKKAFQKPLKQMKLEKILVKNLLLFLRKYKPSY